MIVLHINGNPWIFNPRHIVFVTNVPVGLKTHTIICVGYQADGEKIIFAVDESLSTVASLCNISTGWEKN
jgi:hypothetical protein